jgi:hypothetical protein
VAHFGRVCLWAAWFKRVSPRRYLLVGLGLVLAVIAAPNATSEFRQIPRA